MVSKEIFENIELKMREGVTKEEIFKELGAYDDLAGALAATPEFSAREKYKIHNFVLVIAIYCYALLKLTTSILLIKNNNLPIFSYLLTLIVPAIALVFAREIWKFKGGFYLIASLLGFSVLIRSFGEGISLYTSNDWIIWGVINFPVIIVMFLAYYLKRKLCPNLKFIGARTVNGTYKF